MNKPVKTKIEFDGKVYQLKRGSMLWMGPRFPKDQQWEQDPISGSIPCWMTTSETSAQAQAALLDAGPDQSLFEQLRQALQALYSDTASYIEVNHLGDAHHNRSMQMARDALAQTQ